MSDDVQRQLENVGALLRLARVKAYLTQSDVGHLAGISRQLVSRIEQGCNGEISAYFAVAAALNHRFTLEERPAPNDNGIAALDFGSEPTAVGETGQEPPPKRRTSKGTKSRTRTSGDGQD